MRPAGSQVYQAIIFFFIWGQITMFWLRYNKLPHRNRLTWTTSQGVDKLTRNQGPHLTIWLHLYLQAQRRQNATPMVNSCHPNGLLWQSALSMTICQRSEEYIFVASDCFPLTHYLTSQPSCSLSLVPKSGSKMTCNVQCVTACIVCQADHQAQPVGPVTGLQTRAGTRVWVGRVRVRVD